MEYPIKATKKSVIFKANNLHPKLPLVFRRGDSVPINHMRPFLSINSPLNKVLLSFICEFMNFTGKEDEFHDMVGDTAKSYLSKSSPASHIEEFSLPSSKSGMYVVQNKLKMRNFRGFLKHWKTQISSKGCIGLDTQKR